MAEKVLKLHPGTEPGVIRIGANELPCAVLEDGRRVLTQQGVLTAIGRAPKAKGGTGSSLMGQVDSLPPFLAADNIKPFVDKVFEGSTSLLQPIIFKMPTGQKAYGYDANLLPKICDVYLSADDDGELTPKQFHIAKACNLLVRGLAHVGIAALVDEATNYQALRDRAALQDILDRFLLEEQAKWAKRFPDEFYKEIFRLRGWQWRGMKVNRPSVVGTYTNDIVWDRLTPGLREELRRRNPKDDRGNTKHRDHQFLTPDLGVPALSMHLHAVMGLMRASQTWDQFKRALQRAFPHQGPLPLIDAAEAADSL
jgi:hypothetical protein